MKGAIRPLWAVVLAAGEGTRMRSKTAKPLQPLCGRAMVSWVLYSLAELDLDKVIVVVGHQREQVISAINDDLPKNLDLEFVEQLSQRGTGDAAAVALTALPEVGEQDLEGDILVLPGDAPLIRPATLAALVRYHRSQDCGATLLSAKIENPTGYGRIIRNKSGHVCRIVEELDANDSERNVSEVCTSIYCFRHSVLGPALRRLLPVNNQGEYYLTGVVEVLSDTGYQIGTLEVGDPMEAAGVNDKAQLAVAEAILRGRINERWMRKGVRMIDPEATYLGTNVELAEDVVIYPNTVIEGECYIGHSAVVGPGAFLKDVYIGDQAQVFMSYCDGAEIGPGAKVGPFCQLKKGAKVKPGEVLSNFAD